MDVYDHGRTDTHTLRHPGTRAPCGLVKRIKGDKAMIWSSLAEFFAMGGYGTYVWGSLGVTIAVIYIECFLLRQRRKGALTQVKHELSLDKRLLNEESS